MVGRRRFGADLGDLETGKKPGPWLVVDSCSEEEEKTSKFFPAHTHHRRGTGFLRLGVYICLAQKKK